VRNRVYPDIGLIPHLFFAHAVNSIAVLPSDTPEENKRKGKISVEVVKGKKDQIYITKVEC
jgi:hypothetical protein